MVPTGTADFVKDVALLAAACQLFFLGAGHTRDNIVAWLPRHQVPFGGCFLKSVTSMDLGNLADAVVADWAGSVERAKARYMNPKITVPGHGTITGNVAAQTLALLAEATDQPPRR